MVHDLHRAMMMRRLKELGGFNGTGLPWHCCVTDENGVIEPEFDDLGMWFYDDYWNIIVLPQDEGGEVWLLHAEPDDEITQLLMKLCPGRKMEFSPYPNAFEISGMAVAARMADSYNKRYGDPKPQIQHRRQILDLLWSR